MKRLWSCVGIMIITVSLCFGTRWWVREQNKELFRLADEAAEVYRRGEDPKEEIGRLTEQGEKYCKVLSFFTRNENVYEIYLSLNRLDDMAKKHSEDFEAEICCLKNRAKLIYKTQQVGI